MKAIEELRKRFTAENIPFENDNGPEMERIKVPTVNNWKFSIIFGKHSYGFKDGLLEMLDKSEGELYCYMTAEEVFKHIKERM